MPIGLQHFLYAYILFWAVLFGYLWNLAGRQKRLADDVRALKDALSRKPQE